MQFAKPLRLINYYRLPFLTALAVMLGDGVRVHAADTGVESAEPLILVKTGASADLVVDQARQQIYSTDNCRVRDSFEWTQNGPAARRLRVSTQMSETLAGRGVAFSINYDMEIAGDRVRLFVNTAQGRIEVPVSSSYLRGRSPCR